MGAWWRCFPHYQPQPMGIHGIYTPRQHMSPALRALLGHLAYWFTTDPAWLAAAGPASTLSPGRKKED